MPAHKKSKVMQGNSSYTIDPASMENIIEEMKSFLYKLQTKDAGERRVMPLGHGLEDLIK